MTRRPYDMFDTLKAPLRGLLPYPRYDQTPV